MVMMMMVMMMSAGGRAWISSTRPRVILQVFSLQRLRLPADLDCHRSACTGTLDNIDCLVHSVFFLSTREDSEVVPY